MAKKRILITGASGLFGANLALCLNRCHTVHAAYHTHPIRLDGCTSHCADLTNAEEAKRVVQDSAPDAIVHCAALTSVDRCEQEPELAWLMNVQMTAHLLSSCPPTTHFVYISTDAVFDGSQRIFNEQDTPHPINVYGKTKRESEKLVAQQHPHTIIRTNIYGWNMQDKHSFPEWIISRLKNGQKTPVFNNFFYTPILVNTLSAYVQRIIEKKQEGTLHAGSANVCSKEEFARNVAQAFELDEKLLIPTRIEDVPLTARRPNHLALDSRKIEKEIDIMLETTRCGIARMKKLQDEKWAARLKAMQNETGKE